MKRLLTSNRNLFCALLLVAACVTTDSAQSGGPYQITKPTIASGSDTSTGGSYMIVGTMAQNDAVTGSGGPYSFDGGFWPSDLLNTIDDAKFFVRQHYVDFLNREPDVSGFNFWVDQIASCKGNASCVDSKRQNVSAAYFLSIEFQQTGYLVYRFYKASFNRFPRLAEFSPDTQTIGRGVVVTPDNSNGYKELLESNKQYFAANFVNRSQFKTAYPDTLTNAQFVDALNQNTGNLLSPAERDVLINGLTAGTETRATVLRKVTENQVFYNREFNRAFVLEQYFGYLRRNPDDAPDGNLDGYNFWLNKLNTFNGDYIKAEMVRSFIHSTEYRKRFGAK